MGEAMTGLHQNVEDMLTRLADCSRNELEFVRTLADAIRRVDEQLLREVRSVSLQHELRREAIFSELQNLAVRLCALPARSATAALDPPHPQPHPHRHVAIDVETAGAVGDWRRAAQNIDDELEFSINGAAPRH